MARQTAKKLKNKKYTDAPRYKVIYGYEDSFKLSYKKTLESMVKDISKTAKAMVQKK